MSFLPMVIISSEVVICNCPRVAELCGGVDAKSDEPCYNIRQ